MSDEAKPLTQTGPGLYERLAGSAWGELDEPVRRFHNSPRSEGTFAVRRGPRLASRLLASLLRMPAPGDDVRITLSVAPLPNGERWHRTFNGRDFVTEQRERGEFLAEGIGPTEVWFRLAAEGGALIYKPKRVALRVGPLSVPMPAGLAPSVAASERAAEDGKGVHVSVSVSAPLVGLLISYEGHIKTAEAEEVG